MDPTRSPKPPVHLNDSLHHRLTAYALAFTATGIGVASTPAEGKIIFIRTHQVLSNGTLPIPIAGTKFFNLADNYYGFTSGSGERLNIVATGKAAVVGGTYSASALSAGQVIGPHDRFATGTRNMARAACQGPESTYFINGPFANTTHRFLGLKFKLHGKTHYGWARFSSVTAVGCLPSVTATLTGYAYETVAHKSIIAGKTKGAKVIVVSDSSTLGRLALGAAGRITSPPKEPAPIH
jgi:hypothetical protein